MVATLHAFAVELDYAPAARVVKISAGPPKVRRRCADKQEESGPGLLLCLPMALGSVTSLRLNKSNKPARVAVPAIARNCRRGLRPLVIKKHDNCMGSTMQNGWLPSYQCEMSFRWTEVQLPAEAEAPPLRYELVRSRVELVLVVLGTEIIGSAAVLGFETGISIHAAHDADRVLFGRLALNIVGGV